MNLWFFLKHIASYSGPFESLNDTLHVDMCNYRQSLLAEGSRGAMFIPRGHYKTTVVTEGGSGWELLRDPDIKIRISNAIADFAADFKGTVRDIFYRNDLMKWLYGQSDIDGESWIPESEEYWNKSTMIMPNRRRHRRENSVASGGVTGAAESQHYDLHVVDDPIGLASLDSMRRSNATMIHAKNWFWGNENTLLVSPKKSRVIVVGTRYSVDDLYAEIIDKAHEIVGCPMDGFDEATRMEALQPWRVYYRKAIENGKVIFPENFTKDFFDDLAKNRWWEYVTQYLNDPRESGLAELNEYKPKEFELDRRGDEWFILLRDYDSGGLPFEEEISLSDCDVVMAIDPAATERYISARTSRTAIGIIAMDCQERVFAIATVADYLAPSAMLEKVFTTHGRFINHVRNAYLEANAGFKILGPIIRDEERRRGHYLGLRPFSATGEKDARIRSTLQPVLADGRFYINKPDAATIIEEIGAFPQGTKKDILDMLSIGISNLRRPMTPEMLDLSQMEETWFSHRTSNIAGY